MIISFSIFRANVLARSIIFYLFKRFRSSWCSVCSFTNKNKMNFHYGHRMVGMPSHGALLSNKLVSWALLFPQHCTHFQHNGRRHHILFIDFGKELSLKHKERVRTKKFRYILVRAFHHHRKLTRHIIYMILWVIFRLMCVWRIFLSVHAYLHIVFRYEDLPRVGKVHQ